MKLRNKKTGEIADLSDGSINTDIDGGSIIVFSSMHHGKYQEFKYTSLSELNEEWEDYKPAEPLIRDEKVRKAVRAWAEANDFLDEIEAHSLTAGTRFSIGHFDIEFLGYFIYDLEANKTYTIAELCGEEE